VKTKTPPHPGHLKVKKIGEFKKTKSNRNLLCSPGFGPKKKGKKGLLFPNLKTNKAICKSVNIPSENGVDSNSDKSSPDILLKKNFIESPPKKMSKNDFIPQKSNNLVKLDTNSDTKSDLSSEDSNRGKVDL